MHVVRPPRRRPRQRERSVCSKQTMAEKEAPVFRSVASQSALSARCEAAEGFWRSLDGLPHTLAAQVQCSSDREGDIARNSLHWHDCSFSVQQSCCISRTTWLPSSTWRRTLRPHCHQCAHSTSVCTVSCLIAILIVFVWSFVDVAQMHERRCRRRLARCLPTQPARSSKQSRLTKSLLR